MEKNSVKDIKKKMMYMKETKGFVGIFNDIEHCYASGGRGLLGQNVYQRGYK